jgi:hypothetical protein
MTFDSCNCAIRPIFGAFAWFCGDSEGSKFNRNDVGPPPGGIAPARQAAGKAGERRAAPGRGPTCSESWPSRPPDHAARTDPLAFLCSLRTPPLIGSSVKCRRNRSPIRKKVRVDLAHRARFDTCSPWQMPAECGWAGSLTSWWMPE